MATGQLPQQNELVFYSAATFRLLLDSLARPGKINQLRYPDFLGEPPQYLASNSAVPVNFYALGALLTLLDSEVSFGVVANNQWQPAEVAEWLVLRSGATLVEPEAANFVLVCDGTCGGILPRLNTGTLLEPETSASVIYCVEWLELPNTANRNAEWLPIELTGAGIADTRIIKVKGLDKTELSLIQAARQNYPLGLDVYLIDKGGHCLGLPRTTKLKEL